MGGRAIGGSRESPIRLRFTVRLWKLAHMIRLYGVAVAEDAARALVAALLADGDPWAVAAARTISHGLASNACVAFTVHQRDAILAALEGVSVDGLGELRRALMQDALERHGSPAVK